MDEMERRFILSKVALGEVPPDIVITNANLFNSLTGEFVGRQSVWIKNNRIAYAGPDHDPLKGDETTVIDAGGMTVLPGLIEGHTHTASNRYGFEEFVKYVIPTGVTTVITETIELATVAGRDGIEYLVEALKGNPFDSITPSPHCAVLPHPRR